MPQAVANDGKNRSDGRSLPVEALRASMQWPCFLLLSATGGGCVIGLVSDEEMWSSALEKQAVFTQHEQRLALCYVNLPRF